MTPTILVLDDEASVTSMMQDTLSPHGYRVVPASCAREALEIVRTTKVDLIIADVFMPEVDGISFLDQLAQQSLGRKVPVIMASGCGSPEARNRASQRGAIAYLQKPFQLQQLLTLMHWAAPVPERSETQPQGSS